MKKEDKAQLKRRLKLMAKRQGILFPKGLLRGYIGVS